LAYRLARSQSRFRWVAEVCVNLPVVLPPVVTGYLLLILFGRNGPIGRVLESVFGAHVVFTWIGAAIAAGVIGFPFIVRSARLGFESVDPRLERAARSLGASRMRMFFSVSLPLASRAIVAGTVLAFARAIGEFGATILVAGNIPGQTQTIPLLIYSNTQTPGPIGRNWRLVTVSVVIAAAAILVSEWLERRRSRDGRADL
jgi:molybdate transport system permease protein